MAFVFAFLPAKYIQGGNVELDVELEVVDTLADVEDVDDDAEDADVAVSDDVLDL